MTESNDETEKDEKRLLVSHEVGAYVLEVIEGADRGARWEVADGERRTIGKSAACDIVVADPQVSRRHAVLEPAGLKLRLVDLGSSNGTFVDDLEVVEACLEGGEKVRVGGTLLRLDRARHSAKLELCTSASFGHLFGESLEMRRIFPLLERLARSNLPVLIEGETGTGKEVLAESLHQTGSRSSGPFVVFDCTAVPASLLEAALFGHERGSFTGAVDTRKGVLEQANGGTLLIDEIGELELSLQAKLLRALERLELRRVGGDQIIRVDVRVLAATRRDLEAEVQAGRFRDDLFFRLAVGRVELPPLRRRRGDIALLAKHFWRELGGRGSIDQAMLDRFVAYPWPGNVRELQNSVARHIALGDLAGDVGALRRPVVTETGAAATDPIGALLAENLPFARAKARLVDEFSRRYVHGVLEAHRGDVGRAAEAAGVSARYLQMLRAKNKA